MKRTNIKGKLSKRTLDRLKVFKSKKKKKEPIRIECFKEFLKYVKFPYVNNMYDKQFEMVEFSKQAGVKLLLARRKIGKTELVVIMGTLHLIHLDNTKLIKIITQKHAKGKEMVEIMGVYINKYPELFNGFTVKKESINSKQNMKKDKLVSIGSLGSPLRGARADRIILEDLLTTEACSSTDKEKTIKKFEEAIDILGDANGDLLVIGNPVTNDDLYSALRGNKGIGRLEVWNSDVPREHQADINQMREAGKSDYSINVNYLGVVAGGVDQVFADVTLSEKPLDNLRSYESYAFIDPANVDGGDYTALTVITLDNAREKLLIYGYIVQKGWYNALDDIVSFLEKFSNLQRLYYESNTAGDNLRTILIDNYNIPSIKVHSSTNKEARIGALQTVKQDLIFNNSIYQQDYNKQIQGWSPKAKNDDAIDSLAMLLLELNVINLESK